MYKTGTTPTRLPDETHDYIWDEQDLPNSIVNADGSKILYGYKDFHTPRQLHLVDTATGAKSFILQTSSGLSWPNFVCRRLPGPHLRRRLQGQPH